MEAAKEWGWSPTAILLQTVSSENPRLTETGGFILPSYKRDPRKPHPLDYALALACKMIADERCSQCGTPAWWAYSSNNEIQFKVEDHTCEACAERDRAEEKQEKRQPGTVKIVRTVPAVEGEKLPTRTDFYEEMARRAEWEAKVKADPTLLDFEVPSVEQA